MVEWLHRAQYSLVLFTVLTQTAVGIVWVLFMSDILTAGKPDPIQDRFHRIGSFALAPLTALGLLFSTTHLGRPMAAYRALRHFETSWLSREIWAFGLFFGLVLLYTYLWWQKESRPAVRRAVGVATGLAGALGVLAQAMVYQVPGRPMWNHPSIFLLFGATVMALGPLAAGVLYGGLWKRLSGEASAEAIMRRTHRHLVATLVTSAIVYALGLFWRMNYLAAGAAVAAANPAVAGRAATGAKTINTALSIGYGILQQNRVLTVLEMLLAVGLPVAVAVGLWEQRRKPGLSNAARLVAAGLALMASGHLIGRALFYLTGRPWF